MKCVYVCVCVCVCVWVGGWVGVYVHESICILHKTQATHQQGDQLDITEVRGMLRDHLHGVDHFSRQTSFIKQRWTGYIQCVNSYIPHYS